MGVFMRKTSGCLCALKNARNTIRSELEKENIVRRQNVIGTIHAANKLRIVSGLDDNQFTSQKEKRENGVEIVAQHELSILKINRGFHRTVYLAVPYRFNLS